MRKSGGGARGIGYSNGETRRRPSGSAAEVRPEEARRGAPTVSAPPPKCKSGTASDTVRRSGGRGARGLWRPRWHRCRGGAENDPAEGTTTCGRPAAVPPSRHHARRRESRRACCCAPRSRRAPLPSASRGHAVATARLRPHRHRRGPLPRPPRPQRARRRPTMHPGDRSRAVSRAAACMEGIANWWSASMILARTGPRRRASCGSMPQSRRLRVLRFVRGFVESPVARMHHATRRAARLERRVEAETRGGESRSSRLAWLERVTTQRLYTQYREHVSCSQPRLNFDIQSVLAIGVTRRYRSVSRV